MKLLDMNMFEMLASQSLVTPSEVAISLYGLDPYISTQDIPAEIIDELNIVKRGILRNVKAIKPIDNRGGTIKTNTEVDADLVFGAAYQYIIKNGTPDIIKNRIQQSLDYFYKNNKKDGEWKKYIKSFGGQLLIDEMESKNRKGQGSYRKNDELKGTYRLVGLLLLLLREKSKVGALPSSDYGSIDKPMKQNIYADMCSLAKEINPDYLIGVGRSTFYTKIDDALFALSESVSDDN